MTVVLPYPYWVIDKIERARAREVYTKIKCENTNHFSGSYFFPLLSLSFLLFRINCNSTYVFKMATTPQDFSTKEEKVIVEATNNMVVLENASTKSAEAEHEFEYEIEDEKRKQDNDCEGHGGDQEEKQEQEEEKGWFGRLYSRHKIWFR